MGTADFRLVRPVAVSGDVGFSRASPKWVFDRTGMLVQVAANTVAVTYDPSNLSKAPYALVEPASTNLLPRTESVDYWVSGNAAIVTGTFFGRDGVAVVNRGDLYGDEPNKLVLGLDSPNGGAFTGSVFIDSASFVGASRTVDLSVLVYDNNDYSYAKARFNVDTGAVVGEFVRRNAALLRSSARRAGGSILELVVVGQFNVPLQGARIGVCPVDLYGSVYVGLPQLERGTQRTSYISNSTAGTATRAADVIAPGAGLVGCNVPINEPAYSSAATFAQGVVVYDPATFLTYQSLSAGNTGKALTDATAWGPLKRVVNRWLMLDKVVNSQTKAANEVTVLVQPGELVNTLGILNVEGASVTVAQTDSGYIQTKSLVSHDPLSWYDFFYTEPIREGDVIFDGIPPYAGSALSISVINPGGDAAIGCCVMGQARTIGQTAWDFTGGILSYSSSETDKFGNVTMVKRDNSKVLNFEVYIPKGFESAAYRLLAKEYTDVEIMIIGAEDYSMTYAYGFLGQWNVPVSAGGEKTAHIEFKGLV